MPPDTALEPTALPITAPPVARRDPGAPPGPPRCPNCGTEAGDRFCPRCGQDQHDNHRTLGSIFGEAIDAFAGWDAKIPASIGLLLARPGRLSNEYLRGRRARYLRPLRLYLMLSVAFFVTVRYEAARSKSHVVKLTDVSVTETPPAAKREAGTRSALADAAEGLRMGLRNRGRTGSAIDSAEFGEFLKRRPSADERGPSAWFKGTFKERMLEMTRLPGEQRDRMVRDAFLAKLGNVAICLVPVYALLLRALYFRSRLYYAEHFVVALHTHAFAFGTLTLFLLLAEGKRAALGLPDGVLGSGVRTALTVAMSALAVWFPVYPFLAFRRVYGGSRVMTVTKYVVLGGLYSVALLVGLVVAVFAAILFG